MARLLLRGLDG